ncbi:MAG: hypothetical protein CM1200mP40_33670 [Gammaproteobacteria bacterium]|nr:MAG: hypothetical protein CM1200mP40_33670 [Gammaproteobacteria bacterium]
MRKQITDQHLQSLAPILVINLPQMILFISITVSTERCPVKKEELLRALEKSSNTAFENDKIENDSDFWEIGGDYEHTFANGNRWKNLFIVNLEKDDRLRQRFDIDRSNTKDLFLETSNRYEEQILDLLTQ